ncbi:M23 family metallopeptidase [Alkalihalobacillus sp. LMS39]|uniref:M23 family metallopeptidase n=1 Tax=Alkalihalobacillus sp. LMS39 TaxID=2924032 RepID=UPI001FB1C36F|nr:M23 family metallopeptidase [Alkalihalobacillus sp. LMS39]UOE92112.1 peptidoglycan DD-metalloendopeptidase family protein [Alkalihalobacillus sp. LMS39]
MNKKKKQKQAWTITVTADPLAPVKQFSITKLLVYVTIACPIILIFTIIGLSSSIGIMTHQKAQLSGELESKDQMIQSKDEEIAIIQQQYNQLEKDALAVQSSIEQFKEFEEQLSELNLDMPGTSDTTQDGGSGGIKYDIEHQPLETSSRLIEIKQELPDLIANFEDTYDRLLEYQEQLRTVPTLFPAADGRITSQFGNRKDPFTRWTAFHSGTDIAAPLNTAIFAAADGKVTYAGRDGGYGLVVRIKHDDTYETLYAHLNRIDVEVGDEVTKGDTIAGMGTTGRSTGVHLHYEIRRNGEVIDPYDYMTFHEKDK